LKKAAPTPFCPAIRAVESNLFECAKTAALALGLDVFWPMAHDHLARQLETTFAMPDYARDKARTLSHIPNMPQNTARLLLRAASSSLPSYPNATVCAELSESFKLLGPAAMLPDTSAWLFPGFSLHSSDRASFSSTEARGPRDTPEMWIRRRGEFNRALETGRHAEFPLAQLIAELAGHGCPSPWESSELDNARIPSEFRALVESWHIGQIASEPALKSSSARL
jgi:hypothetical protein